MADLKLIEKFTVDAPVERVWKLLLNMAQLFSFLRNARLDEQEGGNEEEEIICCAGALALTIGPLTVELGGSATLSDLDYFEHSFKVEFTAEAPNHDGGGGATLSGSCKLVPIDALGIEDPEEAEAAEQCAVAIEAEADLTGSMSRLDRALLIEACKGVVTQLRDGINTRMADEKAQRERESLRIELDVLQGVLSESAAELEALKNPKPPVEESSAAEKSAAASQAEKDAAKSESKSGSRLVPASQSQSPIMVMARSALQKVRPYFEKLRVFIANLSRTLMAQLRAFIDGPLRRLLRRGS